MKYPWLWATLSICTLCWGCASQTETEKENPYAKEYFSDKTMAEAAREYGPQYDLMEQKLRQIAPLIPTTIPPTGPITPLKLDPPAVRNKRGDNNVEVITFGELTQPKKLGTEASLLADYDGYLSLQSAGRREVDICRDNRQSKNKITQDSLQALKNGLRTRYLVVTRLGKEKGPFVVSGTKFVPGTAE